MNGGKVNIKLNILRGVHSAGLWVYCFPGKMTVLRGDGTILRKYRSGCGWMRHGHFQKVGVAIMAFATKFGNDA